VTGLLIYVDTSTVRPGTLDELKRAIDQLVEFIDSNEPQILAYNVYLSDDGSQMTVVHIHANSASLDHHMEIAGPAFRRFADLLTLTSISVYGEPSTRAVAQLRDKAAMLGGGTVSIHSPQAGFARFASGTRDCRD